ncbi:MAG: putative CoA-binding protein [bacterium]|jgi:predicted CoA-binding protein
MITTEEAVEIIQNHPKVAIVGLSPKEERPSYRVGKFLQQENYKITPINPIHKEILGETSIASLQEIQPNQIDWIDLFVNPAKLMSFVDEIIRIQPKLVWCQIGVVSEEFEEKIAQAEIPIIMDVCPKIELGKLETV